MNLKFIQARAEDAPLKEFNLPCEGCGLNVHIGVVKTKVRGFKPAYVMSIDTLCRCRMLWFSKTIANLGDDPWMNGEEF